MEKKSVSVRLENVTKRYKNTKGKPDVIAVNNSNLEIQPGELITLLGPSGCGKTTTLRPLYRLINARRRQYFRVTDFFRT